MSDQVLDFLRTEDPRLAAVPNDELTRWAGTEFPELKRDPQFAKVHALREEQAKLLDASPVADAVGDTIEEMPHEIASAVVGALKGTAKKLGEGIHVVGEQGRRFAEAPVETLGRMGVLPARNWASTTRDVAGDVGSAAGQVAAATGLELVGVPPVVALAGPAALETYAETDDPQAALVSGATAAVLPKVVNAGRGLVARGLSKAYVKGVSVVADRLADGSIATRVAEQIPGVSSRSVQRALEAGGGQLAAQAFLAGVDALQGATDKELYSDDPAKAKAARAKLWNHVQHGMARNAAMAILAAPELLGEGPTATEGAVSQRLLNGEPIRIRAGRDEAALGRTEKPVEGTVQGAPQGSDPSMDQGLAGARPSQQGADGGADLGNTSESPNGLAPDALTQDENLPVSTADGPADGPADGQQEQTGVEQPSTDVEQPGPVITRSQGKPGFVGADIPGAVYGDVAPIKGANNAVYPGVYAWVPDDAVQASHAGPGFAPNPAYAPLVNTRDYSRNPIEAEKVIDAARAFDPADYLTVGPSASTGPMVVSQGSDGVLRVLGGNGRRQMVSALSPAQRGAFDVAQEVKAGRYFGLPPRPPGTVLVRLTAGHDVQSPASLAETQLRIDLLNKQDSQNEETDKLAKNDAAKLPLDVSAMADPKLSLSTRKLWIKNLIGSGVLDRASRVRIVNEDKALEIYSTDVFLHAGHRIPALVDAYHRKDRPLGSALKSLVVDTARTNLKLRQDGAGAAANAISEMMARIASMRMNHQAVPIPTLFGQVAEQVEGNTVEDQFVRGLAATLRNRIAYEKDGKGQVLINAKGQRLVDWDGTEEAWRKQFDLLDAALDAAKETATNGDLMGGEPTSALEVLSRAVRNMGADVAGVMREDGNQYSARLKQLNRVRKTRTLTKDEAAEYARLELQVGQETLFPDASAGGNGETWEQRRERMRAELEARAQRRLMAGPLVSQGELLPGPGQMALFEGVRYPAGVKAEDVIDWAGVQPVIDGTTATELTQAAGNGPRTRALLMAARIPAIMDQVDAALKRGGRPVVMGSGLDRTGLEVLDWMLRKKYGPDAVATMLGGGSASAARFHGAEVGRWEQKGAKVGVVLHPEANVVNAGDETAALLDRRRAYKDPRQIEFEFWNGLQTMAKQPRIAGGANDVGGGGGKAVSAVLGRAGFEPIVQAGKLKILTASQVVKKQCLEYGSAAALNLPVASVQDVGQIATLYWRNAAIEVSRFVLVKDGKIIHAVSDTMYSPNMAQAGGGIGTPHEAFISDLADAAARMGADGLYLIHNHPSGNVNPSDADQRVAQWWKDQQAQSSYMTEGAKKLRPLFKGFIVIDHGKYTVLDSYWHEHGYVKHLVDTYTNPQAGPDPLLNVDRAVSVHDADADRLAMKAAGLGNANLPVIVLADTRMRCRGVMEVPSLEDLSDPNTYFHLRQIMASNGAMHAHLHYDGPWNPHIQAAYDSKMFNGVITSDVQRTNWDLHPITGHDDTTAYLREGGDDRPPVQLNLPGVDGPEPIRLGGMEHVMPVEMPEIVGLARTLMGKVPSVAKMSGGKSGYFSARGGKTKIALDARMFSNPIYAAKVLAHEIGHLIDYLPNETLSRGNLLGRLATLDRWMGETLPSGLGSNKAVKAELVALTQWWRPYDPATVSRGYDEYRRSARELYADALSVLINDPRALLERAPQFYEHFWDLIGRKPEVQQALFDLQDFLRNGKVGVLDARQAERRKGYEQGEIKQAELAAARAEARTTVAGWWTNALQVVVDQYQPIRTKQSQAERIKGAGPMQAFGITNLPKSMDAREATERVALNDVLTMRLARRVWETVVKPLEARGISLDDLGEYQELRRIVYGDSSGLANPGGEAPMTARQGLLLLHSQLGHDGWDALMRGDEAFRRATWPVITDAYRSGLYSDDLFASLKKNRDTYAAFGVLKYLEDYVPAAIKARVGTLDRIGNPVVTTLLKMITIQRAAAHNRAKQATVNLLTSYFPDEIKLAKEGTKVPRGRAELMLLQKGVPTVYHVDPYIAAAFKRTDDPSTIERLVKPLDWMFRNVFYPAMIKFNLSFGLFLSPARDVQRTMRNVAGALDASGQSVVGADVRSMAEFWRNASRALREAAKRNSSKEPDPRPFRKPGDPPIEDIVREMEGVMAIATPYQTFRDIYRADTFGRVLQRYKLLPSTEDVRGLEKYSKVLEGYFGGLERAAVVLDTAPKIDAYLSLRRQGVPREQAAIITRNFSGLPNVTRRGSGVNICRALIPFWNVFVQGLRSDANLFVNPQTMGGMFMRWGMGRGGLRILAALAAAGAFGEALKRLYGGISDYDKTSYLTMPFGQIGGGPFGPKTVFLRLPEDDIGRLLGGMTTKLIQAANGQGLNRIPTELFDFGSSQVPTMNPMLTIPQKWLEYAQGVNPIDPFHNRPIVPPTAFSAGGLDSLEPMAMWTVNQTGYGDFLGIGGAVKLGANSLFHFNEEKQTTTEATISSIPVLNRILKISDYGYREQQQGDIKDQQSARDRETLKYPAEVLSLRAERGALARIPFVQRTQEQQDRFEDLDRLWYSQFKRDDEKVRALDDEGKKGDADQLRKEMKDVALQFVQMPVNGQFRWVWDASPTQSEKAQPATKAQLRQYLKGKQGVNQP